MNSEKIKLSIAYDQQLIADGLKVLLDREMNLQVLDSVTNGNSVPELIIKNRPDILLLELARWPYHYLDYIKNISSLAGDLKLILISEKISYSLLIEVMTHVNAYLLRTCSIANIILAIEEVARQGKYLCTQEIEEFVSPERSEDKKLTSREEEVLTHWLTSDNNRQIASNLHISESTVRTHIKNIKEKTNSTTYVQMVVYACKNNILNGGMEPICQNCKYSCKTLVPGKNQALCH